MIFDHECDHLVNEERLQGYHKLGTERVESFLIYQGYAREGSSLWMGRNLAILVDSSARVTRHFYLGSSYCTVVMVST